MHHLPKAGCSATYPESWVIVNPILFARLVVPLFPTIQHSNSNCRFPVWKQRYLSIFSRSDHGSQLMNYLASHGNQQQDSERFQWHKNPALGRFSFAIHFHPPV